MLGKVLGLRASAVGFVAIASIVGASTARADQATACNAAYEKADVLVHGSGDKLIEAREHLQVCASTSCKAWMVKDCTQWLADVERRIPTAVLSAKEQNGTELSDVTVTMDGKPLAQRLDGRAIEVDPGEHAFVFTAADGRKVEERHSVLEGEKAQLVVATFEPSPSAPKTESVTNPAAVGGETPHGVPWRTIGFVAGGVGIVGLALGSVFGVLAISKNNESNANGHCDATGCDATGKSLRNTALGDATISTVGIVAGAVLTAGGAALVLFAPAATPTTARLELGPVVGPGRGGLQLRGIW